MPCGAHLKMSIKEQRAFLSTYFNNMAAVASGNPYAWFNGGKQWNNITEPSDTNPLFNFPYTKYMNPVPAVNQAASVLDDGHGYERENWKYPRTNGFTCTAALRPMINGTSWRESIKSSSPVVRFTAEAALKSAGLELSDMDFFDLYSCFPCATIIAAMEIGLPIDNLPPLSITGGLSFLLEPGNRFYHAFHCSCSRTIAGNILKNTALSPVLVII